MKTFFVVVAYVAMVGALDLGGAVWTSLHRAPPDKVAVTPSIKPSKAESANRAAEPIPSDT